LNFELITFDHLLLFADAGYLQFISDISASISFAGFELRRAKWPVSVFISFIPKISRLIKKLKLFSFSPSHQGDDKAYLGFVNVISDEPSKRATPFKSKDNKADIRYTAYFTALVRFSFSFYQLS
jgi:hypothetical protein